MKKILSFIVMLVLVVQASAYDFVVDGIYYNLLSAEDQTCEVTHGDGNDIFGHGYSYQGSVNIPSSVYYSGRTLKVTSIESEAFAHCFFLDSVTIPNSVTRIGSLAFKDCVRLVSATIPNSITSIEPYTFWDCKLNSVTIPNSVTSIGNDAFYGNCI